MKWFRRSCAMAAAVVVCTLVVRAQLPSWAQETVASTTLEAALYRVMGLPDGTVRHLRPAWESRAHLSQLIVKTSHPAELYSLRARQEERLADFLAAEKDWKQAAGESQDKLGALKELADFYERRVQATKEVNTLLQLSLVQQQPYQEFQPVAQQAQWLALARAIDVSNQSLFPAARYEEIYDSWIRRYPKEVSVYQAYLDWAVQKHDRNLVVTVAAQLKATFPNDAELAVSMDADLAMTQSGSEADIAVYAKAFTPLWPEALRKRYFDELGKAHQLRVFLGEAQTQASADPISLAPALKLYFYYEQEGHKQIADQKLLTLLSARATANTIWNAEELKTVAALLLRASDYDESARCDYMLYQLPGASETDQEIGLSAVISILLDVPEQALSFGNRDLSLYRNIAQMDRRPGFMNGILTLALNTTSPDLHYQNASQTAVAYFHRASASLLIDKLRQQFPAAPQTAELESRLFFAYATYGQQDAIITTVPGWLDRNPKSPEHVRTALLLADAYASKNQTKAELAIYDRLLTELANESGHMPIGQVGEGSRSREYPRILNRYTSRLVELKRVMDAVALFRREIDRDPNDAGLYERFALFLEQNRLDGDLVQTYREALVHFKDVSWASKLARFYVRQEQDSAYEELAHQVTDTFKGSDMAGFLNDVSPSGPALSLKVNLYAHKRFPYNLVFIRNLQAAYERKETLDDAAYGKLLREYWFYDANLRTEYFQYLSSRGELNNELAKLQNVNQSVKDSNLAALELLAAGEAWLTHYENAAPVFIRLASLSPGDSEVNDRAIRVERSLASSQQGAFDSAVRLAQQDVNAQPANLDAVTRVGEIYADREMFSQAAQWWNRVDAVRPGAPAGYLNSAAVFWDYFQFKDALRVISESRKKLGRPFLFGYEAGAIYENEGDYKQAVDAYLPAVLEDGNQQARARLLMLAKRKATASIVDANTARLTSGAFSSAAFQLRLLLLEQQNKPEEVRSMLVSVLSRADQSTEIAEVESVAKRLGFDEIAADCLKRTVGLTTDPIEKLQARIELARFYETHNNAAGAQNEFGQLLKDEPKRLGVIRAAVDFYWREKQPQAAVSALEGAVQVAQSPYHDQLEREAADKASSSGQYEEARRLLDLLLTNDPYNGDLLAEKASTFARANDTAGLVNFYAAEVKALHASTLAAADKKTRLAEMRRGYVLALTTTGQLRDALEQYQLVLNAYPDDSSLASEVASFADAHQLAQALVAYYEKATSDSPRDYRWPLVLARVQTGLRHYPEAVAAYDKAAYVRPDRADLYTAKADLETRLLHFDDAIKSYQKVYELSFHDSQYLEAQAELYARLNNLPETLRLLRAAYIDSHPNEPSGYVEAMRKLSGWHMFSEEAAVFEQLRPMLSENGAWKQSALILEAQALMALHRPDEALLLAGYVKKKDDVKNKETVVPFARAMGEAAAQYLEPGERAALADRIGPGNINVLDLAEAAGLREVEAAELIRRPWNSDFGWQKLDRLQSSRLLFEPLGKELENLAPKANDRDVSNAMLNAAFRAYQKRGDNASQLRLAEHAGSTYPSLFVKAGGDLNGRLASLARRNPTRANQVLQYLILHSSSADAALAIAARGQTLTPLWTSSYRALNALYSLSGTTSGSRAFDSVMGPRTVGGQLSEKGDSLQGAEWFYYAARYGDYLGYRKSALAQDYLPAWVETNAAASDNYVGLADALMDSKQAARASQLYREALQLSPERADICDRLAVQAIAGKRRAEAIQDWRRAFQIQAARVEKGPLPAGYWPITRSILAHVNFANAMVELKPDADNMLRTYARRNGTYEFNPFLEGIFDHVTNRQAALAWVIEIAQMKGMEDLLNDVLKSSDWIQPSDKDPIFRAQIERFGKATRSAAGQEAVEVRQQANERIEAYARFLGEQKRWPDAWAILQQIQPQSAAPVDLVLESAAWTRHIDELLNDFREKLESAPAAEQVLAAAGRLQANGNLEQALKIEEFEYGRELADATPPATAWFGMARVRLQQKRNDEALALIRKVTLSVGAPFENLSEAIHVLEQAGLKADAANYAMEWKTAEPWSDRAQLTFAGLKGNAQLLDAVRRRSTRPYRLRAEAARSMRTLSAAIDGADELSLLTHQTISAVEAAQPFYVEARLDAASQAPDPVVRTKLYREVIALEPQLTEPRLMLAQSALQSGSPSLALAAFDSYERREAVPDSFVPTEKLMANDLAARDEWARALRLYRDLVVRVTNAEERSELVKARDLVAQKQDLANANLARSPVVSDQIHQPRIVRPKLKALPSGFVPEEVEVGEEQ